MVSDRYQYSPSTLFPSIANKVMACNNTPRRANEAGPPEVITSTTTARKVEVYTSIQEH